MLLFNGGTPQTLSTLSPLAVTFLALCGYVILAMLSKQRPEGCLLVDCNLLSVPYHVWWASYLKVKTSI